MRRECAAELTPRIANSDEERTRIDEARFQLTNYGSVLQVIGVAVVMPTAAFAIYVLSSPAGAPPFWQVMLLGLIG